MKSLVLFFLVVLVGLLRCDALMKEVACESYNNGTWTFEGRENICYMTVKTSITSPGFKISSNKSETISALTFFENRKVNYLPTEIYKSFPNLTEILGQSCSIRAIYKDNFRGLVMLRELWLVDNQIERIDSDTFEGLGELEWLDLSRNNIKWINGRLFAGLNKLAELSLIGNECISKSFVEPIQMETLTKVISEKCGFCKSDNLIEAMICERTFHNEQNAEKRILDMMEGQTRQIEMLETLVNKTLTEKENCQSELDRTVGSITRLEGQVGSANSQISLFNTLDAARNQNFLERLEELREDLGIKVRENENLLQVIQKLNAELYKKDLEIKDLRRIASLSSDSLTGTIQQAAESDQFEP